MQRWKKRLKKNCSRQRSIRYRHRTTTTTTITSRIGLKGIEKIIRPNAASQISAGPNVTPLLPVTISESSG